jgi:hypothetical protein
MAKSKTQRRKTIQRKVKHRRVVPMKCSRCGFTTRGGIAAMAKHYRSKHPRAMKRKD